MPRQDVGRMAGTIVLTFATAMPYVAGIWMAWAYLFSRLPMPLGVLALMGVLIAPAQLVRDIIDADRSDRRKLQMDVLDLALMDQDSISGDCDETLAGTRV